MISVVIPTYNRANTILNSINSVLNQTYEDLELIIVDDCSSDNTQEVVESIGDSRIRYHKLEQNSGACHARNVGILMANGQYVAFQDSDDIWFENKLSEQVKAFDKNPDADMVFCSFRRDYGLNRVVPDPSNLNTSGKIFHTLIKKNFISTITILCKKDVLEALGGFDESLPAMQDWELSLRIACSYNIYHLKMVLAEAMISPDSISSKKARVVTAMERVLSKHIDKLSDSEIKDWKFKMANVASDGGIKNIARNYFKESSDLYSKRGIFSLLNYFKLYFS